MSAERGDPEIELWSVVAAVFITAAIAALFVYLACRCD